MFHLFQFISMLPDSLICFSNRPKTAIVILLTSGIIVFGVIATKDSRPNQSVSTEQVKERRITKVIRWFMKDQ